MTASTDTSRSRSAAASIGVPTGSPLADLTGPTGNLAFVHRSTALAGTGEFARLAVKGSDAAGVIGAWFVDLAGTLAGSVDPAELIAFVSLGFEPDDESIAVVPMVTSGRRRGRPVSVRLGAAARRVVVTAPGRVRYSDASLSVAGFTSAVFRARAQIRAGQLSKVVLAHDLAATTENDVDERYLLSRLAAAYPDCATFAVDGLVGASPELLVRRFGSAVTSRVLAGTDWLEQAGDRPGEDLLASAKNRSEHGFAVASVASTLESMCTELTVPVQPHPLVLANLTHLATEVVGVLADPVPTALEIAARLHPTAAVGGTPTDVARRLIRVLEPSPRGRYAAPVGWLDATGDGEFALALRCGQISGRSVRMMAGCGIVADSVPELEAREAQVKMIPIREALQG